MDSDNSTNISNAFHELQIHMTEKANGMPECSVYFNTGYACLITGFANLLVSFSFLAQVFNHCRGENEKQNKLEKQDKEIPQGSFKIVLPTFCIFSMLMFTCGVIGCTCMTLISTFVVIQLGMTKQDAATLTLLFWFTFAAGRLACAVLVKKGSSMRAALLCSISLLVTMIGLTVSALFKYHVGVWVFCAGVGLFYAPTLSAALGYWSEQVSAYNRRISSTCNSLRLAGGIAAQSIIGYLMEWASPMWFCYFYLICSLLIFTILMLFFLVVRFYVKGRLMPYEQIE